MRYLTIQKEAINPTLLTLMETETLQLHYLPKMPSNTESFIYQKKKRVKMKHKIIQTTVKTGKDTEKVKNQACS